MSAAGQRRRPRRRTTSGSKPGHSPAPAPVSKIVISIIIELSATGQAQTKIPLWQLQSLLWLP